MAQLIGITSTATVITGTIRYCSEGSPECFAGFSIPRNAIIGTPNEANIAKVLGIDLSDPEPPTETEQINAAVALLPDGYEVVPITDPTTGA